MTSTSNKLYPLQTTGTNVGTWGTVLNNGALSVIDNNLGGTLNISVAGSSNINLTASQASFLIHNLTGALTGNINYIFPALGGFFAVNNQTTGAFTVTVTVVGGSGGILVPQGNTVSTYIDATVPQVEAFTGTSYVFAAGTVTGTANALVVAQTFPSAFTLSTGTFITFTPTALNTLAATLNVAGTGAKTIKKVSASGIVDLAADDLATGSPVIAQYNGTYWIALNILYYGVPTPLAINTEITFAYLYVPVIATTAITLTLDSTASLGPIFSFNVFAKGGAVTLTPNVADSIQSGTAGASFTIPIGASAQLVNDGAGNWYVYYLAIPYVAPGASGNVLTSNGTAWASVTPTPVITQIKGEQLISAGSGNFTTPSNTISTTRFKFTLTAGGGGGASTLAAFGTSGGGAGSTAIYYATGLSASQTCAYVVGAGGAGGSTSAGSNGSASSLTVGATTITCPAGSGGARTNNAIGGAGGTIPTNGTINIPGGDGFPNNGGGSTFNVGGSGGASFWGGGGSGGLGSNAARSATVYGAGGGASATTNTGGAGMDGVLLVEWD